MTDSYFFDSYAILEIIFGNENYTKYKDCKITTTKLNLMEIHYKLLRELDEYQANLFLEEYSKYVIDFDNKIIRDSSVFKLLYKERNLSMTDCIGYVISLRLGIKFLTGDKQFTDIENVEFVK